jgi:hypothetical protein
MEMVTVEMMVVTVVVIRIVYAWYQHFYAPLGVALCICGTFMWGFHVGGTGMHYALKLADFENTMALLLSPMLVVVE